jgi:CubicO group peptidase (beta-lactamase class C family)
MDAAMLERADAEIRANLPNVYSLLVVKGGDIVFEKYYQGSDETAGFGQRSVTKSILSAVFGITRQLGFFPDLDQPIRELMPEYFEGNSADDPRNKITLRHLLTMTAGFSWNEQSGFGEPKPDSDWAREALNLGMDAEPGVKFNYNSAAMHLLSVLITRETGRSASQIANTYLFGKVGMNQVGWPIDPQANSQGFSGLVFTSRDMARFGYLYLNNGCWDGEQIVSADWVRETTREHSPHPEGNDLGYGYLWWTTKDKGHDAYFAAGYGRQYIQVVPALDLIVVMTGNPRVLPDENKPTRYIITDYVIPAVKE